MRKRVNIDFNLPLDVKIDYNVSGFIGFCDIVVSQNDKVIAFYDMTTMDFAHMLLHIYFDLGLETNVVETNSIELDDDAITKLGEVVEQLTQKGKQNA